MGSWIYSCLMNFDPFDWERNSSSSSTGEVLDQEDPDNQDSSVIPSRLCHYGDECRDLPMGKCNRQHLPLTKTPCLYGPNCKTKGCKRIHPQKIFEKCRRGDGCTNQGCRFLHDRDFCRFGKRCTNEGCKYIHPRPDNHNTM